MNDLGELLALDAVPFPALACLPAPPPCPSCRCCLADLCKTATEAGTACLLLAAPQPDPATTKAVLVCPCAPAACDCRPPTHVRGIARCRATTDGREVRP